MRALFYVVSGNVCFLVNFVRRDVLIGRVRIENEFKQKEISTSGCDLAHNKHECKLE